MELLSLFFVVVNGMRKDVRLTGALERVEKKNVTNSIQVINPYS